MNLKKRLHSKRTYMLIAVLSLVLALACGTCCYYLFAAQFRPAGTTYLYIDRDDTADSVCHKLKASARPRSLAGFRLLTRLRSYGQHLHTGCYAVHPDESAYEVFNRLYRGHQTPVRLTIAPVRTLDALCRSVGRQLMIDSAEVASLMTDSVFRQSLGYQKATLPALFIPDTYEVYWNMNAKAFFARMQKEHQAFWNSDRLQRAKAVGLTPDEVCTLASIVDEETNNKAEKPVVAGLYLNRLRIGMMLQADPTVKFAVQDFGLRRITNQHLRTPSPYNTYLHAGLPPGPIRIASAEGIDAVLNPAKHRYLYMCAKEDLSGTHNFATSLGQHLRNARRYQQALNRKKIFR